MNNPKQLLQLIHARGEHAAVSASVHDQARAAAQELNAWIDGQLAADAKRAAEAGLNVEAARSDAKGKPGGKARES